VKLISLTLFAAAALFFVNLGSSSIWDANEAFYVETPREMLERGDLVVPYFNFEPRINKPVLSYWIVASLYKAFGVGVGVQRFGIAIGGLVMIGCAFYLGRLASRKHAALLAGLLAAAGLAVDPRFLIFSRRILIDVWTGAFMALTLTFFLAAEQFPARRRIFLLLMYVSVGLGVLTKGPVAALLPALVFAAYLVMHGELRRVREMLIPTGLVIVLAIVAPWYVALYQREGWTPIASFFIGENLGRYTEGIGFVPDRGISFYPPVVFADGFPLSLFLVPAAMTAWRARERVLMVLWLWIAVIVLFFSFSHDKQDLYILPIVPAVAAVGASAIARQDGIGRALHVTSLVLAGIIAAAGTGILYVFRNGTGPYGLAGARAIGAIALVGGLVAAFLTIRGKVLPSVTAALITLMLANWVLVLRVLPDLERYKPVPALTAVLAPRLTETDVLATYSVALPSMVYYLRRHVNVYYAPEPFVRDALGETRMFGVLSEDDYAAMRGSLAQRTCVIHRVPAFEMKLKHVMSRTPPRNLVLITNHCEVR
jgi:4-amino-4-deoxy-L-arabinose transferase-like glycosyltransferase